MKTEYTANYHWEQFCGNWRAVFRFAVGMAKSSFTLFYCCLLHKRAEVYMTAVDGLVYIDTDTRLVARLIVRPVNLPPEFSIRESNTITTMGW